MATVVDKITRGEIESQAREYLNRVRAMNGEVGKHRKYRIKQADFEKLVKEEAEFTAIQLKKLGRSVEN